MDCLCPKDHSGDWVENTRWREGVSKAEGGGGWPTWVSFATATEEKLCLSQICRIFLFIYLFSWMKQSWIWLEDWAMWNRNNSILQVVLTESSSPCFIKEEKGNSVFIARISSHLKWKCALFGGWLSWCPAHSTLPVPLSLCIFLICSLPTGRTYATYLSMDLLEYPWH